MPLPSMNSYRSAWRVVVAAFVVWVVCLTALAALTIASAAHIGPFRQVQFADVLHDDFPGNYGRA